MGNESQPLGRDSHRRMSGARRMWLVIRRRAIDDDSRAGTGVRCLPAQRCPIDGIQHGGDQFFDQRRGPAVRWIRFP